MLRSGYWSLEHQLTRQEASGVQGTTTFTQALYVPGLHKNLILVLKLTMPKNKCLVESKRGLVMEVKKSGYFYVTECLAVFKSSTAPETVRKD